MLFAARRDGSVVGENPRAIELADSTALLQNPQGIVEIEKPALAGNIARRPIFFGVVGEPVLSCLETVEHEATVGFVGWYGEWDWWWTQADLIQQDQQCRSRNSENV